MQQQQQEQTTRLEVPEDREWQEVFWKVQRVGWALMGLFVLGAILGLTGSGGPLADATARAPGLAVDHPTISRWESNEQLVIRLPASAAGQVELTLSPEFDQVFAPDSIVPQPASSAATADGHRFTFDLAGAGEKQIVFNVTTGKPALARRVGVRLGDGPPATFTVTVLP